MDQNEEFETLLEWVNDLNLLSPVSKVHSFNDGVIFSKILFQIDPECTDLDHKNEEGLNPYSDWIDRVKNLKKVYKELLYFYLNKLGKNLDPINIITLSRNNKPDLVCQFLKYLLYASMYCERKSKFVKKITRLSKKTQLSIMKIIKNLMESKNGQVTLTNKQKENENEKRKKENENTNEKELLKNIFQLKETVDQQKEELNKKTKTLKEQSKIIQQSTDKIKEMKEEKTEITKKIKSLEKENDQMYNHLKKYETKYEKLKKSHLTLGQELESKYDQELEKIMIENTRLKETEKQKLRLEYEIIELNEQLEEFKKLETLHKLYKEKIEQIPQLKDSLILLEKRNEELLSQIEQLNDQLEKNSQLQNNYEVTKDENQELKIENQHYKSSYERTKNELNEAIKSRNEGLVKYEELSRKNTLINNELIELKEQLKINNICNDNSNNPNNNNNNSENNNFSMSVHWENEFLKKQLTKLQSEFDKFIKLGQMQETTENEHEDRLKQLLKNTQDSKLKVEQQLISMGKKNIQLESQLETTKSELEIIKGTLELKNQDNSSQNIIKSLEDKLIQSTNSKKILLKKLTDQEKNKENLMLQLKNSLEEKVKLNQQFQNSQNKLFETEKLVISSKNREKNAALKITEYRKSIKNCLLKIQKKEQTINHFSMKLKQSEQIKQHLEKRLLENAKKRGQIICQNKDSQYWKKKFLEKTNNLEKENQLITSSIYSLGSEILRIRNQNFNKPTQNKRKRYFYEKN
ncbi:hook protein [Anaeramoeba flamelloides]|uniref:Hook protein n=1 Tax=Anaeramoeba flamelloides TaxID=1746091 RepID=A0AAV7ZWT6_9EUKA|nr:hook protein [Anaeramoeba flamelloides]